MVLDRFMSFLRSMLQAYWETSDFSSLLDLVALQIFMLAVGITQYHQEQDHLLWLLKAIKQLSMLVVLLAKANSKFEFFCFVHVYVGDCVGSMDDHECIIKKIMKKIPGDVRNEFNHSSRNSCLDGACLSKLCFCF
jgi:hypothetical protein